MKKILKTTHWAIILASAASIITGTATVYILFRPHFIEPTPSSTPLIAPIIAVTALGRFEPQGDVIHLSGGTPLEGTRLSRLLVNQGDKVRAGQVIAILNNYNIALANIKQAQAQIRVAQARFDQVRAGAKTGNIAAHKQQLVVRRRNCCLIKGRRNATNIFIRLVPFPGRSWTISV